MPGKIASRINGKSGGRPKINPFEKIKIPDIKYVILTQKQYEKLTDKYGIELLKKALDIFDKWLIEGTDKAKKYIDKNHYAHFRSDGWVINHAMYLLTKSHQTKP